MSKSRKKVIYQEFGQLNNPEATQRATPDLPSNQQNLKVEASRKGRKGKTVTIISGFQTSTENLSKLLKQLKTQCGSGGTIKEDTLEIQGNHREKISEFLKNLGYKVKISGG